MVIQYFDNLNDYNCTFLSPQIIYVSLGANRGQRKVEVGSSTVAAPSRKHLPMMLLLAEPHFSRLFQLLQQLSTFKPGEIPEVYYLFHV